MTTFQDMAIKLIAGHGVALLMFLADNLILGIFPGEYFSIAPAVLSFLGNGVYSFLMLGEEWKRQDESGGTARKMTRYGYYILASQPFAAALMTFLLVGLAKALTAEGSWLAVDVKAPGEIVIGIVSGFFFTYLTRKQFYERAFRRYVEKPLLGADEDTTNPLPDGTN